MAEDAARGERSEAGGQVGALPRYESPRVDDLGTLADLTAGGVGRGITEGFSRS